jgi:hypothetical protein
MMWLFMLNKGKQKSKRKLSGQASAKYQQRANFFTYRVLFEWKGFPAMVMDLT